MQVHPTAVYSGVRSAVAASSAGISGQDAFIQLCGGTPEGIVAAVMMGFQKIIYVSGSPKDSSLMSLPSRAVELSSNIDYMDYVSPDPEDSQLGFLAVEAVKMLVPYVRNHVMEHINEVQVAPPHAITIPPLQVYTFIPVTGRVVVRTILASEKTGGAEPVESQSKSSLPSKPSGPGGSGEKPPPAPAGKIAKTKKVVSKEGDEEEDDDLDAEESEQNEGDEDEESGADDDDLKALEKLEKKSMPMKRSKQGVKRKAGAKAGGAKKKARAPKN